MDIKKVLTLIESAEQQTQPLTEGKNMAKEMVMQHYTKQEIKSPIKRPVSRLNEYFKVVDNEMLNVIKEEQDAKRVEVKKIVGRVLERLDEGKKVEAPKPRNFVAKNQQTSGAGAHKDKKKAEKQGEVKHKKQAVPMDESEQLDEKAVSKAQQRFMGMVHAAKKGEKPASKAVADVAKGMSAKAAKDFAKIKHKGLPDKKLNESQSKWEISPYQKRMWIPCPDGYTTSSTGERVKCGAIDPNRPNEPGYWSNIFVDKNGNEVKADKVTAWLKSLSQKEYDAWADEHEGKGIPQGSWAYSQAQNQKSPTSSASPNKEANKKIQSYLNKKYDAGLAVDGIIGPKTKAAIDKFMKEQSISESVAGPEKCWPGHRKVGTKPGTGKNKGKRVNDCEKIEETIEVGAKVKVYSNVLKKSVLGTIVELKEGKAYVNYANTKIVMGHPVEKVQLAEVAGLARFIPGVGLVAGGYDAYQRAKQGDYTGAALSAGAGLAGLVPGLGTAAATGLVGAQLARDKARTGSFLPSYDEIGSAGKKTPAQQAATPAPSGGAYTIKKGDNLTKIAKANNTTIKDIMAANPQIKDPNKIFAGAKLNLPGQAAAPAAKPAAKPAAPAAPAAKPADATQQAATPAEPTATTAAPAAASGAVAAFGKSAAANAQPDVNAGGASVTNRKLDVQAPVTTKQGNVTTTTSGSSSSATLKGITQDMVMNHPVYKAEMAKAAGKNPQQVRMAQQAAILKAKDAIGRDPSYLQNYKAPAPVATATSNEKDW